MLNRKILIESARTFTETNFEYQIEDFVADARSPEQASPKWANLITASLGTNSKFINSDDLIEELRDIFYLAVEAIEEELAVAA